MQISLRCLPNPRYTSGRTLILDISNVLEDAATDSKASTSTDVDGFQEGCCTVQGIWLAGGSSHAATNLNAKHVLERSMAPIRRTERITLCISLKLSDDRLRDSVGALTPSIEKLPSNAVDSSDVDEELLRSLFSVTYASLRLMQKVQEVKRNRKIAVSVAAPKTLSAIRRENTKSGLITQNYENNNNNENQLPADRTKCTALFTLEDIARQQASVGSTAVAVAWSYRWRGALRRGVHFAFDVPLLPTASPQTSGGVTRMAADCLSVSVHHVNEVYANMESKVESFPDPTILVDVWLELKSLTAKGLTVWADALDWDGGQQELSDMNLGSRSNGGGQFFVHDDGVSRSVQGCKWLGKVRYEAVQLAAYEVTRLPFVASVPRSGVYDLKRFG